ncbi:MFS transporter [Dactylosporangium sp. NPDC051484]|uniref:CynX/NimT family MFS transporter n=1 Tax=Dactylosporangium sp. NPDC051484 TaxID=3154942 RepID=UPI00344D9E4D
MATATGPIPRIDYPAPSEEPLRPEEIEAAAGQSRSRLGYLVLGVGLLLIGLNLRIGVTAVSPVLADIQSGLGLSEAVASLLTTIPVFAFGAFAFLTPGLSRRIGIHRLLGAAMATLIVGIVLRVIPGLSALFGGTLVIGAAIAIANVLLPAAIKRDLAHRTGLMMGLYATVMSLGAALASGFTVPLLAVTGGQWRPALALWAIPAAIALAVWIPQMLRSPGRARRPHSVADATSESGEPPFRVILTDPIAIGVTALMGIQSMIFYATITWLPTLLQDAGIDPGTAGWMLSFSAIAGVVAALFAPALTRQWRPTWLPIAIATVLTGAGLLGVAIAPTQATLLWMILIGLGQSASIALSLSYIVWRSPDAHHAGHLSTMAQGFGYLFAAFGPLGLGALHSATNGWTIPIIALGVLLIAQLLAGAVASRPRHIRAKLRH